MKNAVVWDGRRVAACSLQPPAHAGSSLADFSTLKMEAIRQFAQDLHGAICQKTAFLRMINEFGATNRIRMIGETEVLGDNPPNYHCVHH
jgi:hypothetical protein